LPLVAIAETEQWKHRRASVLPSERPTSSIVLIKFEGSLLPSPRRPTIESFPQRRRTTAHVSHSSRLLMRNNGGIGSS
jgi:hypothetical protein